MPTPSTPRQPNSPPERTDAPLLRDLLGAHAESLARVLRQHLAARLPGGGSAFDAAVAPWRERGPRAYTAWLGGVTLGLLRDADGLFAPALSVVDATGSGLDTPRAGPACLAASLSGAVPPDLSRALLRLARSGLDQADCLLFLCKPPDATESDIRIQK